MHYPVYTEQSNYVETFFFIHKWFQSIVVAVEKEIEIAQELMDCIELINPELLVIRKLRVFPGRTRDTISRQL